MQEPRSFRERKERSRDKLVGPKPTWIIAYRTIKSTIRDWLRQALEWLSESKFRILFKRALTIQLTIKKIKRAMNLLIYPCLNKHLHSVEVVSIFRPAEKIKWTYPKKHHQQHVAVFRRYKADGINWLQGHNNLKSLSVMGDDHGLPNIIKIEMVVEIKIANLQ